jgi:hypothetical protein
MALSSRHDDPILDQLARETFAMFPHCYRCGQQIERFEDADVRVHLHRVVHRDECPPAPTVERVVPPESDDV